MSVSKPAPDLQSLFQDAQSQNMLTQNSVEILVDNLNGFPVAGAMGPDAEDLAGSDVSIVVRLVDHSTSMSGNESAVCDALNDQVTALKGSKLTKDTVMSTWLFNHQSQLVDGFVLLDNATVFNTSIYNTSGSTSLYFAVLDVFTGVTAYVQQLVNQGANVRVIVVVVTDGEDTTNTSPSKVAAVARDLLRQEIYTLVLVAFGAMDADKMATDMGFPLGNVLRAGATPHDIRKAMNTVSQSVIKASQTIITTNTNPSTSFFS
jgi:hypothetical protein